MTRKLKFHPYADIFPLLDGEDFDALVGDIETHGQREEIWLYEGKILDGRNRFLACNHAGVQPRFREFDGDDDAALAFVVSANMHRRHLTTQQRAMAAARVATLRKGRPSENTARAVFSQSEAAESFDVSTDSVQRARKVIEKGSKPLQRAVEAGEVPLKKAAAVVDQPKAKQLAAAKAPPPKKVEPEPEIEESRDGWVPEENEEAYLEQAEKEYADAIDKVMAADDKLAAAHDEIKRQAAEIASLKLSRDGFMNGRAAVVKMLKKEQRKVQFLSKELDKARAELKRLGGAAA